MACIGESLLRREGTKNYHNCTYKRFPGSFFFCGTVEKEVDLCHLQAHPSLLSTFFIQSPGKKHFVVMFDC